MTYRRKFCSCGKRYTWVEELERHLHSGEHERMKRHNIWQDIDKGEAHDGA